MNWLDDLIRFLKEVVTNEHVVHMLKHISIDAFKHFLQEYSPNLWDLVKENIAEVLEFVKDWIIDWL